MNPRHVLLAATLFAALASADVEAAPALMRTILLFTHGAWTSPVAVVLHDPNEWTRWNERMVASERAAGAEPLPAGIDWCHEAVLVVAIGERSTITKFALDPPRKSGHTLHFTGRIETSWIQTFSSPCHVVAIDRRFADAIVLDPAVGTLEQAFGPTAAAATTTNQRAGGRPADVRGEAPSWGAVKHAYR